MVDGVERAVGTVLLSNTCTVGRCSRGVVEVDHVAFLVVNPEGISIALQVSTFLLATDKIGAAAARHRRAQSAMHGGREGSFMQAEPNPIPPLRLPRLVAKRNLDHGRPNLLLTEAYYLLQR